MCIHKIKHHSLFFIKICLKLSLVSILIFYAFFYHFPNEKITRYGCYAVKGVNPFNDPLYDNLQKEFKQKNIHLLKQFYCPQESLFIITNSLKTNPLIYKPERTPVFLLHQSSKPLLPQQTTPYHFIFSNIKQNFDLPTEQISFKQPQNAARIISHIILNKPYVRNYLFISRLKLGGLGNQMFIAASWLAYAQRFHKKIIFLEEGTAFSKAFNVNAVLPKNLPPYLQLIHKEQQRKKIGSWNKLRDDNLFKSDQFNFIGGYHQAYYNLHDSIPFIQETFKFNDFTDDIDKQLTQKFQQENSVCIHVRLGDYIAYKYPILFYSDYFANAIQYIKNRVKNPVFYVFSNEPKKINENNFFGTPVQKITHNTSGSKSFRDMQLMSLCKHNIISNSTFSWWAALLNKNPNKIVIYPDIWLSWNKNWLEHMRVPGWIEIKSGIVYNSKGNDIIYPQNKSIKPTAQIYSNNKKRVAKQKSSIQSCPIRPNSNNKKGITSQENFMQSCPIRPNSNNKKRVATQKSSIQSCPIRPNSNNKKEIIAQKSSIQSCPTQPSFR